MSIYSVYILSNLYWLFKKNLYIKTSGGFVVDIHSWIIDKTKQS